MDLISEMKQLVETKRDELSKLEAALDVLKGQTPFELKHPTGKEAEKLQPTSRRSPRRRKVVMPPGHYEAIIGAMLHAESGKEFSAKDVVTFARAKGAHATKSAVQAVVTKMVADGWLEPCGRRGREILRRRRVMDPARWSTLYKEGGGS